MLIDELELFAKGLICMGDTEHAKDIRQAIDTMRKYQKITEIITKWHNDMNFKTSMAITDIEEVIKDGE